MYAVVSETEFYGHETCRAIVSLHEEREKAETAADGYNPDYDPSVGFFRLGHNQACATSAVVMDAEEFDVYDPWGRVSEGFCNAAVALANEDLGDGFGPNDVPDEYLFQAMEAAGQYILHDPEGHGHYWLCQ